MKKTNILKSAALLSVFAGGAFVANNLVEKITRTVLYRSIKDNLPYEDLMKQFKAIDLYVENESNIKLHGIMIETRGANKTVIICHPFGHEASEMSMYIPYFKKKIQKANILLINARAHGKSDGYIRGLGINDMNDLVVWNQHILKKYGNKQKILMYGKEMGANTILNAASKGMLKNVSAIISDGAYTSPYDILSSRLKRDYKITNIGTMPLIRKKIIKDSKMDIKYSTVEALKHNKIPTLFFHALLDDFVDISHVYPLYNACGGVSELFVTKEEQYLCHISETDEYKETLSKFLDKYL